MAKEKKEKKERKEKKEKRDRMSIDNEEEEEGTDAPPVQSTKKSKTDDSVKFSYNLECLAPIAKPLASPDLTKKLLKTVKRAANKKHLKRGIKEVVKGLRKGDKGLVILAGDISPIDVITHLPVLCEESGVPYVYVPSKSDLGITASTKRPTSVVMVIPGGRKQDEEGFKEYKKYYDECYAEAKKQVDEFIL